MQLWQRNQPIQNSRFIIQEIIGSGGYGITYKALEKRNNKLFVIKTLNHIQQIKPDFQQSQTKFMKGATRKSEIGV